MEKIVEPFSWDEEEEPKPLTFEERQAAKRKKEDQENNTIAESLRSNYLIRTDRTELKP